MIIVGRNKLFKRIYVFWYIGFQSKVVISLMEWFSFHLDLSDENTHASLSMVVSIRCALEYIENKVFIASWQYTFIIISLYNDLSYIIFALNITLGNTFKDWIGEMHYSITQKQSDNVATGNYCVME